MGPKHGGAGTQHASSLPLMVCLLVIESGSGPISRLLLEKSRVVLSTDNPSPPPLLLLGCSVGLEDKEGIIIEGNSIDGNNELKEGNILLELVLSPGAGGVTVLSPLVCPLVASVVVGTEAGAVVLNGFFEGVALGGVYSGTEGNEDCERRVGGKNPIPV